MVKEKEVLLKVEELCQYFKMGPKYELKAVDKVSFDIHKGEVFGLVGESGCGKTTIGRAIIKLYDATGGNVYFKGERIVAGVRSYKDKIKAERASAAAKFDKIKKETDEKLKSNIGEGEKARIRAEADSEIAQIKAQLSAVIEEQREKIKAAHKDQKECDKMHAKKLVDALNAEWVQKDAKASSDTQKAALKTEYKEKIRLAKRERLINEIQMIFQDPIASLDPRMTVRDIIAEGLVIKGIKDKEYIDEKVFNALEQVGLVREHASRYPHEFSGGQRQRIGVARSVIMRPELIIADEPVSALDVSIQAQVINLLNDLRRELGLTLLFIAHDLSVIKYFSDRIGVMYYGKLVELATSQELFNHPLHPYTRSLLSAIPLPAPVYEKQRKRITYNPVADHDYSKEQPTMREVCPGHFIYCNTEEFERYQKEIAAKKA